MKRDLRLGNGRPTCLVVDDHPAVVDAVSAYLQRHGISVIAHAREGQEALSKIEDERPDIALIDLALPGLLGIEVIRRAKRTAPRTTAIVYTGHADNPATADALDAGARGLVLEASPLPDLVPGGRQLRPAASMSTPRLPAPYRPAVSPRSPCSPGGSARSWAALPRADERRDR